MTEEYNPEWYEEEYFTRRPYSPYYVLGDPMPLADARFKVLQSFNPKSVLDVGCAYGLTVKRCLDAGIYSMGTDISKFCEKQAEILIPGHYIRATAWDLPFKDKEFDVIFCTGVLEHLPESKIEQTFSEFVRVADRYLLDISFDCASTDHHICNHDFAWWLEKCPHNTWISTIPNTFEWGRFTFKK